MEHIELALNERPWLKGLILTCCLLAFSLLGTSIVCDQVLGQTPSDLQDPTIERFLQVLLRRPHAGTALDRVYTHHVRHQSLDQFLSSLDATAEVDRAGEKQMVLGLIQLRRGQYSNAVAALVKADRWLGNNAMASYQLGKAYRALGDTDSATDAMQRAVDRRPTRQDAPQIFLDLGRVQAQSGNEAKAIETWQLLQTRFPSDKGIAERIARTLAEERQFAPALQKYKELAKQADTPERRIKYQIEIAELHLALDQPEKAKQQFQTLLTRLRPTSWLYRDVRDRMESVFLKGGDYKALAKFYSALVQRSPDNLSLVVRLGQILSASGQLDEAQQTLKRAIRRAPNDIHSRQALIDVLIRSGKPSETTPIFEQLVALDPNNPDHFLRWGQILLSDADIQLSLRRDAAARVWKRLLESRADDPVITARIAKRLASIEHTDDAIALYRKSIELSPESPQYREYLAKYLVGLGRIDEAITAWQSIASGPRRNRDSLVHLAEVLDRFKFNDQSLQAWREAATFDLHFDQRLRYARVLSDVGNHDEAILQLESASQITETRDERRRVLVKQVSAYNDADKIDEKINELSGQAPTAKNQRFLALLAFSDGRDSLANRSINVALESAPDDSETLVVAVDIAEKQDRPSDSIKFLERLIESDHRFKAEHLRRLISLHRAIGNVTKARQAAGALIDATPASPGSYGLFAEIAFQQGRDEQAIAALRSAMELAPRDNSYRLMLANHLAVTNQTDAARELYWEALAHEFDWDGRRNLIDVLVPIYRRNGDLEQFARRLQSLHADADNRGLARRFVASYWQSVGDFERSNFILRQLHLEQPNDTDLLEQIVANFRSDSDDRSAVDYQHRLVDLVDTRRNIALLVRLQLSTGVISHFDSFVRELEAASDPSAMMSFILSVEEIHHATAAELCRIAIKRDASLWGIKSVRSQLLLLAKGDDRKNHYAEAIRLAEEVQALHLKPRDTPPSRERAIVLPSSMSIAERTRRRINAPMGAPPKGVARVQPRKSADELNEHHFIKTIGEFLATIDDPIDLYHRSVDRIAPYRCPEDFYQATWISRAVQVIARCKLNLIEGNPKPVKQVTEELFPMPSPEQTDDPSVLKELLQFHHLHDSLTKRSRPVPETLLWRMVDVDPSAPHPIWTSSLLSRSKADSGLQRPPTAAAKPFDEDKLRILAKWVEVQRGKLPNEVKNIDQISNQLRVHKCMINEFRLANKEPEKLRYPIGTIRETSLIQLLADIQVALWTQDVEQADALVARLADVARRDNVETLLKDLLSEPVINWMFLPSGETEVSFVRRHSGTLVEAWIAHCARRNRFAEARDASKTMVPDYGVEDIQVVVGRPDEEILSAFQCRLRTTFSRKLMNEYQLSGLMHLARNFEDFHSTGDWVSLPSNCVQRLAVDLGHVTSHERKLRQMTHAFAAWWDGRSDHCRAEFAQLSDTYPTDSEIQIETARLEFENLQTDKALERLSQIPTPDDQTVIQVEMALIHLMLQIGIVQSARDAAEKILALKLDSKTRKLLQTGMRGLGLTGGSTGAVIPSSGVTTSPQRKIRASDSSKLRLARKLLESGNPVTASKLAFSVLQKRVFVLSPFRQRALGILASADRLQPLIAATESRFRSSPTSERLRQELADLYLIDGQSAEAERLWEDAISAQNLSPQEIAAEADTLLREKKHHQAAMMYLYAFEREPLLWNASWTAFVQAGELSKLKDRIYSRLVSMDIRTFSLFSLCNVIRINQADTFSEFQREFTRHVIQTHPSVPQKLSLLKRFIPAPEQVNFPRLMELLSDAKENQD